jgi:gas vesicle protein
MEKKGNNFMWGVAVGALLGLLFAPRKGDETRRKISEDLKNLKEGLDEAADSGIRKYNELKEEASPAVENVKKKAKPYVTALKDGLEGKEDFSDS